ncbi:RNA 2',3'-cyclic phosphodiesterase [Epibacterium sp. SM1979]|uniref:RNA 2',3'-cyclic phosphodiesterase n=1 Tax=Tritonibacter litoralis TaxID=2662264 RepID=A0A843YE91_9RHOB|nr:RNA 2',3'-cyclic phosphodiesterase [Tritonibacter litoralis]MQQ09386.1 RNA 2',3'-cyclic phosphodiesterase [Tritonibacter litoralis]
MRAFVGLPLSDTDLDQCERLQGALRIGRLVAAENLHLTLAFLDDQEPATLEALHHEMAEIVAPELALRVDHIDVMGGNSPRVLCAMVAEDPTLSALRDAVRQAARRAEIDLPRERFRPHMTLVRFPRRMDIDADQQLARYLTDWGATSWSLQPITEFTLYQSVLSPEGPTYTPLAEYPLGG